MRQQILLGEQGLHDGVDMLFQGGIGDGLIGLQVNGNRQQTFGK
jgi:hypothetical protein